MRGAGTGVMLQDRRNGGLARRVRLAFRSVWTRPSSRRANGRSFSKRALDVALAGAGLLLSAPVWVLVAAAIKLEDGGPVFYTQERWGRGASRFRVRKFRTMVPHADRVSGVEPVRENDGRVTRVGRLLRASGLDELPELLNILRGEMSFVGPRPLAVGELVPDGNGSYVRYEEIPGFFDRLAVAPGLTGLATVYIPKHATPRQKLRYDRLYIRRRSFWLDVRLILLSIWISLRGRWETTGRKV
jgi:lipopolysaccharide/colanic/teichoic acid biosynthesis glycosyltransferase